MVAGLVSELLVSFSLYEIQYVRREMPKNLGVSSKALGGEKTKHAFLAVLVSP